MAASENDHRCEYRQRVGELEVEVRELETKVARVRELEAKVARVGELEEQVATLREALASLERRFLGPKSEKLPSIESELSTPRPPNDLSAQAVRKARQQERLELEGHVAIHKVEDSKRTCPKCGSSSLKPLSSGRKSHTWDYVPGRLVRIDHVQETLSCRCGDYVVRADVPQKIFERSRYGPGLVAHIVTQKCGDSMPIYRLEKQFKRLDVPIRRSTMTDLFHRAAEELAPVAQRLGKKIAESDVVQADETSLKVQRRKKRGFIWTFLANDTETGAHMISYRFSPDRSGQTPRDVLGGTEGTLVVDAYTGYNSVVDVDGRERAGCLAHFRRKLFEAQESAPQAREGLELILDAYRVEHNARELDVVGTEEHLQMRQAGGVVAMEKLRKWIAKQRDHHPPRSLIGRALSYATKNWEALTRFLSDARIPIDNNASERALRVVALGRKNFLFVGHDAAGENLAGLYSLVSTCEANAINPEEYLADVLMRLDDHPASEIDDLLPHRWRPRSDQTE